MKKKVLLIVTVLGAMIPFHVNALNGSVNLECDKVTLDPGESTTCHVTGNITEEVSTVSAQIKVGEHLTLVSVSTDSIWEGDGEEGNVQLYTDVNKIGTFKIASFVVQADDTGGVSTHVSLTDVHLSDADFQETSFTVPDVEIQISSVSTINTLSNLTVDGKTITGFSPDITNYRIDVGATVSSIEISATKTSDTSTITGDIGVKKLSYGENRFEINVTGENSIENSYILIVNRPESRMLSKLAINNQEIELQEAVYEYTVTVEHDVTSLTLTSELQNPDFVTFVDDFGPREITDLKVGNNTVLVKVVDRDNQELIYTINVERLDSEENPGKDDEETTPVENPDTGVSRLYMIGLGAVLVAMIAFIWIKKKDCFKKI